MPDLCTCVVDKILSYKELIITKEKEELCIPNLCTKIVDKILSCKELILTN